MKLLSFLGLLALSLTPVTAKVGEDDHNSDYYVLHLEHGVEPRSVGERLGLAYERELQGLDDHHIFRSPKSEDNHVDAALTARRRAKRGLGDVDLLDSIYFSHKEKPPKYLEKRTQHAPRQDGFGFDEEPSEDTFDLQEKVMVDVDIQDPMFPKQWHLFNTFEPGNDINVTDVWRQNITGSNVTVALLDDGLDMDSTDLKDNYFAAGSWDFNDDDPKPKPVLSDDTHGTHGAGAVAAAKNNVCGIGVAFDAKVSGIRILSAALGDSTLAEAMTFKNQLNDIYTCSWGPPDDGIAMDAPGTIVQRAMVQGTQKGRGGHGSVFVFASGNGRTYEDNCNFDGYANSIYSITIGALDYTNQQSYYSEQCSANLAVTYSSGSGRYIQTTDVGKSNCYDEYGGTSAAAPIAAGVLALALSVRPELSWRDLQYLVVHSAVPPNDTISYRRTEWQTTAIGKQFSHDYGYGSIDAWTLVEMAKDWNLVKPQDWFFSSVQKVEKPIPQGKKGLSVHLSVTKDDLKKANLERVEHVTVTLNVDHTFRGDLSVELISPENVTSHLATRRSLDESKSGYYDWTFMSVAHWGESGVGKWTLVVKDTEVNRHSGSLLDWDLKLWGEAIEAKAAKPLPLPGDERSQDNSDSDDDEEDVAASAPLRVGLLMVSLLVAVVLV